MIFFMIMPTDKRQSPIQILAFDGEDLHEKLLRHHFTGSHFIAAYVDHYEWAIIGYNGAGSLDPIFVKTHLLTKTHCAQIYSSAQRSLSYHQSRQKDLLETRNSLSRYVEMGGANRDLFRVPQEQLACDARFV